MYGETHSDMLSQQSRDHAAALVHGLVNHPALRSLFHTGLTRGTK